MLRLITNSPRAAPAASGHHHVSQPGAAPQRLHGDQAPYVKHASGHERTEDRMPDDLHVAPNGARSTYSGHGRTE